MKVDLGNSEIHIGGRAVYWSMDGGMDVMVDGKIVSIADIKEHNTRLAEARHGPPSPELARQRTRAWSKTVESDVTVFRTVRLIAGNELRTGDVFTLSMSEEETGDKEVTITRTLTRTEKG